MASSDGTIRAATIAAFNKKKTIWLIGRKVGDETQALKIPGGEHLDGFQTEQAAIEYIKANGLDKEGAMPFPIEVSEFDRIDHDDETH